MSNKEYQKPEAEKLDFDFSSTVTASGGTSSGGGKSKNPAQCTSKNPGQCGGGFTPGQGDNVGSNSPGNCSTGGTRKQPHKC